jgi:hypothetical protein
MKKKNHLTKRKSKSQYGKGWGVKYGYHMPNPSPKSNIDTTPRSHNGTRLNELTNDEKKAKNETHATLHNQLWQLGGKRSSMRKTKRNQSTKRKSRKTVSK